MTPGTAPATSAGIYGLRAFSRVPLLLQNELPRYVFRALAFGLYQEGQSFKREFRDSLAGKFKSGGRRVGNAFKVYTTGETLSNLRLGVFTRWLAASIYETGGVIVPKRGRYLVIPITPKAYTAKGRVKATWRRNGQFLKKHFEGCWPFRLKNGNYLLLRNVSGIKSGKGTGYRGRQRTSRGRTITDRARPAVEVVFLLIRRTSRKATLNFFNDAQAYFAGPGANGASYHVGRGLRAIAREIDKDI